MYRNMVTLNPSELVKWCRARKAELGLTNASIAEKTGVPPGTLDRIFSGTYSEFKYSSIQPVVAYLVGLSEDVPQPEDEESEQGNYYYNTIEGYRLIVENKNFQIQQLTVEIESRDREIERLRQVCEKKDSHVDQQLALLNQLGDTVEIAVSSLAEKLRSEGK